MLVTKTGSKLWRYAYNFDSKQKLLALGQYPVTSLADARIKRDDAKKLLAEGSTPPSTARKSAAMRGWRGPTLLKPWPKNSWTSPRQRAMAPKTLKKKEWLLDFANKEFGKRSF